MIISNFFYTLNSLNEHLFKCFILGFCLIPLFLFASIDKPKNNNNNRDTTILSRNQAYEFVRIRFKEDSLFMPEQMREDVLFFYDKILKTHPNPYHVISKDSLDKKVEDILKSLDKPMNRREFWLKIAALNACFDAHTVIMRTGDIFDYTEANSKPHISKNLANNIIMSDSLGNLYFNPESEYKYRDTLLDGKQIKRVNGIPAKEIVDKIPAYYSHENKNNLPQFFSLHFFLLYPHLFGSVDSYQFEYIKNNNEIDICTFNEIPSIPHSYIKPQTEEKKNVRFNLYEKDSIAIIEINTFDFETLGEHYRKDLETMMTIVIEKNIKHLFIDISRNGGGSDRRAKEILNFIKTEKKKYYTASAEIKISPAFRALMTPNHSAVSKKFNIPDGSIIKHDYYWTKNNTKLQYNQNLYLIQSSIGTYSSSTTLASLVKAYKFGTIIGEETGGLTSSYVEIVFFAMPNTSIPFMCSTKKVIDVGGAMDGRGILPDVEYKIGNPFNQSFTLEQLKEMLQLVKEYKLKNNQP